MEELSYYWSDDGQTVIVIDDDGNEEQLTREEFLEMDIAEEPYKEEDQSEQFEKYYEKYFEDTKNRVPTRPIRESIYESNRWRGLKKVENFLRIEDRRALLESLKKNFQIHEAEKGYYSLLLELTYIAGDLSWAQSARDNQIDGKEDVVRMLQAYEIDGLGIDFQIIKTHERLRQAFEELEEWDKLIGLPAMSQAEKDLKMSSLAEQKYRNSLRAKLKRKLKRANYSTCRIDSILT